MSGQGGDQYGPCLQLLRESDRDRYAATLYLPEKTRSAASALYAFAAEIAAIPDRVKEPMAGEIRLQWWREVILGTREAGNNPVAVALLATLEHHELPRQPLTDLVDARVFDLYHDPMPDPTALEAYCGQTGSVLLQLVALAGGAERDTALADACGHAGVAIRMSEIVRRMPLDRNAGKCPLPVTMLAATGLSVEDWLRQEPDTRHGNAANAVIALALEHRAKAVAAIAKLDREILPVFLPLAPANSWLRAAERAGLQLLTRGVTLSPLRRQLSLAKTAFVGFR